MREILQKKRELDYTQYTFRSAKEGDYETLIDEDAVLIDADTREVVAIYKQLDFDDRQIVKVLQNIRYDTNDRSRGLRTTSRIFGFSPRITYRKDFCGVTSLASESPSEHNIIMNYGKHLAQIYSDEAPEVYTQHLTDAQKKVMKDYRIPDTPFTSGIINKNNPLKYHFDRGNFKGVYSCMVVFKHDIRGGFLSVPEYNVGFYLRNSTAFMFDGQDYLHGVTPITKLSDQAYRFSIVYYSLRQIWNCLPLTDELARIRKRKTERELHRLKVMRGEAAPSDTLKFDSGEKAADRLKTKANEHTPVSN